MLRFCFLPLLLAALTSEVASVHYGGHKVVSVTPRTKEQLAHLRWMRENHHELDFWTEPRAVGVPVHVRLTPEMQSKFSHLTTTTLSATTLSATTMIDDLQSLIDDEKRDNERTAFASSSVVGRYARLNEIHAWLDSMASKHPAIAETFVVGRTYEGRDIKGIKIGDDGVKPVVWIHAGIHAREWVAPSTCVYMIDRLLRGYATDASVKRLVDSVAWFMIPSANPDGYEYSHTTDRMWRKTRTPNPGYSCKGVDPNRNWDDHFGGEGTSGYPCSDIYRGRAAFTEPNTKALSSFIWGTRNRIKAFFSLHSYSQMWLTPWGWTDSVRAKDYKELMRVAKGGSDRLKAVHRKDYEYGPSGEILYPAAGAEDDWAKGQAGIPYSYTLELRPGPYSSKGFILPTSQIIPTGEEVWAGIKWVVEDVYNV